MNDAQKIAQELKKFAHKRVLVATHINPDGDAIGSSAAIAYISQTLGADVRILLVSGFPESFQWLDLPCPWVSSLEELQDWTPDLLVVVDCGDAWRTGEALGAFFSKGIAPGQAWENITSINIDHHLGNSEFATFNWVNPGATAVGEMVAAIAKELAISLSGSLGEYIYLALVSDSGNFSYSNTHAATLRLAAEIVESGLNVAEFTARHENQWTIGRMQLWGEMMHSLSLYANGHLVVGIATLDMLARHNATKDDLEGFASWMRKLKGVKVSLFIREDAPAECKISVRSMGDVDVRSVAVAFSGGGHKAAAGANLALSVAETKQAVLEVLIPLCE